MKIEITSQWRNGINSVSAEGRRKGSIRHHQRKQAKASEENND